MCPLCGAAQAHLLLRRRRVQAARAGGDVHPDDPPPDRCSPRAASRPTPPESTAARLVPLDDPERGASTSRGKPHRRSGGRPPAPWRSGPRPSRCATTARTADTTESVAPVPTRPGRATAPNPAAPPVRPMATTRPQHAPGATSLHRTWSPPVQVSRRSDLHPALPPHAAHRTPITLTAATAKSTTAPTQTPSLHRTQAPPVQVRPRLRAPPRSNARDHPHRTDRQVDHNPCTNLRPSRPRGWATPVTKLGHTGDEGDLGQGGVVGRELRERLGAGERDVAEAEPRVVLAPSRTMAATPPGSAPRPTSPPSWPRPASPGAATTRRCPARARPPAAAASTPWVAPENTAK
jgi:hypothetical protein